MPSGSALSEDLRRALIHMHHVSGLDAKTITALTNVPKRTVYRVLSTWKITGLVKPEPEGQRGRPRAVDVGGVQVSSLPCTVEQYPHAHINHVKLLTGALRRCNDRYLDELKDLLAERCGITVSESTIWRTLQRAGFRLKEVWFPLSLHLAESLTGSPDNEARSRT